jgi:hypothetical protein
MTQRRGGRPRGPTRRPFKTTLRPEAIERLRARSVEVYKTTRAVNRVIEEGIMAIGVVRLSETEDVEITVDNGEVYADIVHVTVVLFPGTNEARIDSASHDGKPFALDEEDEARAVAAAWRKRAES